ncbi:uncharacterized protein LOC119173454 [Rhipicephalus microplus]|uniref:uncharacterized protein LOC119173454 n=1 Tax=Rhipicephalus microplus TaxID=6941 RepID=UPI003F6B6EC9
MSVNSESGRDEPQQEEMQEAGLSLVSYDAAETMDSIAQGPNARHEAGRNNEPRDTQQIVCAEVKQIWTELKEQSEVADLYISTIQETVGTKMAEAVEECVNTARGCLEEKRKLAWQAVSEIDAALERISENDKMLDAVKAAMESTWNTLF